MATLPLMTEAVTVLKSVSTSRLADEHDDVFDSVEISARADVTRKTSSTNV